MTPDDIFYVVCGTLAGVAAGFMLWAVSSRPRPSLGACVVGCGLVTLVLSVVFVSAW